MTDSGCAVCEIRPLQLFGYYLIISRDWHSDKRPSHFLPGNFPVKHVRFTGGPFFKGQVGKPVCVSFYHKVESVYTLQWHQVDFSK